MCTAEAEDRRLKPAKKQREARSYQHGRKVRVVLPTLSRTAQGAWRCCCSVGVHNVHIRIVPSYILLGNRGFSNVLHVGAPTVNVLSVHVYAWCGAVRCGGEPTRTSTGTDSRSPNPSPTLGAPTGWTLLAARVFLRSAIAPQGRSYSVQLLYINPSRVSIEYA